MDARWERLFADLEGQLDVAFDEDEIPELVEAERVSVRLHDRVRGRLGQRLDVTTRGGRRVGGVLVDAGAHWLALQDGDLLTLIPLHAVLTCSPLGVAVPREGVERSLGAALRALARSGEQVVVDLGTAQLHGRLAAVGADHCDLLPPGGQVVSVAFAGMELVRARVLPGGAPRP